MNETQGGSGVFEVRHLAWMVFERGAQMLGHRTDLSERKRFSGSRNALCCDGPWLRRNAWQRAFAVFRERRSSSASILR